MLNTWVSEVGPGACFLFHALEIYAERGCLKTTHNSAENVNYICVPQGSEIKECVDTPGDFIVPADGNREMLRMDSVWYSRSLH